MRFIDWGASRYFNSDSETNILSLCNYIANGIKYLRHLASVVAYTVADPAIGRGACCPPRPPAENVVPPWTKISNYGLITSLGIL